jgi:hypothetical protein
MPKGNRSPTAGRDDETGRCGVPLSRRRLLTVGSAGLLTSLATGAVAGAGTDRPNTIAFDGTVSSGKSAYEFAVSGSVEPDPDSGATEISDSIDGTSVTGVVHRDRDAYRFGGELASLDVEGEADVSVSYGDAADVAADRLQIVAGAGGDVDYSFTATDRIVPVADNGSDSADDADTVAENDDGSWSATGDTADGAGDTYDVWGEITDFAPVEGDYTLLYNGDEVTAYELTGTEPPSEPETARLELVTPADGSVEYTFTTTGEISKVLDAGDRSAEEGNDTVRQNDDGTWTATGLTGNGYGDAFDVEGDVVEFVPKEGSFTIYLDGNEVTAYDLVGEEPPEDPSDSTKLFEIVTPSDGSVEYAFTTTGEISKVLDAGDRSAEEGNDTVRQNDDGTWTATGLTGNGYGDSYRFAGEATAFEPKTGTFTLYLDGNEVTAYDLVGEEPPADGGDGGDGGDDTGTSGSGTLGGGAGYENAVSQSDADAVVRSRSALGDALASASSGDVVFVPGDEQIDLGSSTFDVPDGVTLASDRGVDGSSGALLHTDREVKGSFRLHGSSRLTGIDLRGPHPGDDTSGTWYGQGVWTHGPAEVDNCEIHGIGVAAIECRGSSGGSAHVHHNHLHHNNQDGRGYAVSVIDDGGQPTVEYNYFYYNRHSVTTDGEPTGYVLRYNHFGPKESMWPIDAHSPSGTTFEVHNNVVEVWQERAYDGSEVCAIAIRDVPDDVFQIQDNWFWNPRKPDPSGPSQTSPDQAVHQSFDQPHEFLNVEFQDNHYGEDANVTCADVIPGYDGWRS